MSAVAAARSFQGGRQVHAAASLQDRFCIFLPMGLVEIGCQEEAGLVLKHGVHAHDEIAASIVPTSEVPANDFVIDGQKATLRASDTLDFRFFAQASRPLIGTHRLIAGLAAFAALEATRIHIVASSEERAKQSDFGVGRGMMMDKTVTWVHLVFLRSNPHSFWGSLHCCVHSHPRLLISVSSRARVDRMSSMAGGSPKTMTFVAS